MKSKTRSLGYPSGWRGLWAPDWQEAYFRRELPGLRFDGTCVASLARSIRIPVGWDGIAVVPKPQILANLSAAKTFDNIRALHAALECLYRRNHGWVQYDSDKHGRALNGLRVETGTAQAMAKLAAQPGDFMVFAVQLGRVWPDSWPAAARVRLREREFFLDPYLAACILFAHPERLADYRASGVSCPGAETMSGLVPFLDCVRHNLRGQEADNVILKFLPRNIPRWIATGIAP